MDSSWSGCHYWPNPSNLVLALSWSLQVFNWLKGFLLFLFILRNKMSYFSSLAAAELCPLPSTYPLFQEEALNSCLQDWNWLINLLIHSDEWLCKQKSMSSVAWLLYVAILLIFQLQDTFTGRMSCFLDSSSQNHLALSHWFFPGLIILRISAVITVTSGTVLLTFKSNQEL